MNTKISIIIPCYNEKYSIYEIINKVNKLKIHKEIILVDDYSVDGTRLIIKNKLENFVDKIIFHEKNKGKGAILFQQLHIYLGYCNNSRCRS